MHNNQNSEQATNAGEFAGFAGYAGYTQDENSTQPVEYQNYQEHSAFDNPGYSSIEQEAQILTQAIDSMPESQGQIVEDIPVERKGLSLIMKMLVGAGVLVVAGGVYVGMSMMSEPPKKLVKPLPDIKTEAPGVLEKAPLPVPGVAEIKPAEVKPLVVEAPVVPTPVAPTPAVSYPDATLPSGLPAPIFGSAETPKESPKSEVSANGLPSLPSSDLPKVEFKTEAVKSVKTVEEKQNELPTFAPPKEEKEIKSLESVKEKPAKVKKEVVEESEKPQKKIAVKKKVEKKVVKSETSIKKSENSGSLKSDNNSEKSKDSADSRYWKPMF